MSDITAVILSIGEDTVGRAIESVKRQSLPAQEIIVIEHVSPFYNALNAGAAKVRTAFFVQVDADMILQEDCFEYLRSCVTDNLGIVSGRLKDPLIGRCCCVKLFRRECFDIAQFRDSVSPDTDFRNDIQRHGWATAHVLNFNSESRNLRHILGEHRPEYTSEYTFSKYLMLGRRAIYRKDLAQLKSYLKKLRRSSHSASLTAQTAFGHGLFQERLIEQPSGSLPLDDFYFFESFTLTTGHYKINRLKFLLFFCFNPRNTFKRFYKLGIALRGANAFPTFQRCFTLLDNNFDEFAWIAKAGLSHGIFSKQYHKENFTQDYQIIDELASEYAMPSIVINKFKGLIIGKYRYLHSLLGPVIKKHFPKIFNQLDEELNP